VLTQDTTDYFVSAKNARLIEWNVDVLVRLHKQVEARRKHECTRSYKYQKPVDNGHDSDHTVIDEIKEIITLPTFSGVSASDEEI
jgi:hypothetical protein